LPSLAEAVGYFGLSSSNFTLGSGVHKLKAVWDLHWTVDLKATGAGSHSPTLQTLALVEVIVQLFDVTADAGGNANMWTKTMNRTGATSVHFVGNQQVTVTVNSTFNATHVYQFFTVLEFADAAVVGPGSTTGQASAAINFATGGNGATLVAIKGL